MKDSTALLLAGGAYFFVLKPAANAISSAVHFGQGVGDSLINSIFPAVPVYNLFGDVYSAVDGVVGDAVQPVSDFFLGAQVQTLANGQIVYSPGVLPGILSPDLNFEGIDGNLYYVSPP